MNASKDQPTSRISMQPVEKKSLYLKISDAIYSYIQTNRLKPGDKLPSEREMSAMLQTSRNSVREALRILEDRCIITVQTGKGVFLADPYKKANSFDFHLTNCSLKEMEELQSTLDHQAVQNAMSRATEAEKDRLIATAEELVRLADTNQYSHVLDLSFHTMLYEVGRNFAIQQLISRIREYRFIHQADSENGNDLIWLPTVPQHLTLALALKEKNLAKALDAIDVINNYGFQLSAEQAKTAEEKREQP